MSDKIQIVSLVGAAVSHSRSYEFEHVAFFFTYDRALRVM